MATVGTLYPSQKLKLLNGEVPGPLCILSDEREGEGERERENCGQLLLVTLIM